MTASWNERFQEAINTYHKAVKGNRKASQEAYERLKELSKENQNNVEALAYYASATALLARDTPIPKDKKKYALEGLSLLDQAVTKEPTNITVRILRGNVCLRMPESVFHRTATTIEDFEYLIESYKKDSSILSKATYDSILKDLETAKKRVK
ncbi:hypothetical protein [Bacillus weihaiensis]|uniref:Tetratricopeptide repeat protein n=1 Tax=Bacillus weihaiensis TaxID=1547283 RepID=A0A1L3MSU5_9BACI|nr:hypothetical protein [Bacillus weihaiensis]APH05406.1 hypothetical protein A9C19_11955 [Bacillus weihaiensis]